MSGVVLAVMLGLGWNIEKICGPKNRRPSAMTTASATAIPVEVICVVFIV
jgi:hypothetical protein